MKDDQPTQGTASNDVFNESDRIVVATPCYGGEMRYDHANALFAAVDSLGGKFLQDDGTVESRTLIAERFYLQNESHIDRARNKLANRFMRTRYNWLLFIDADVVFPPSAVAALWVHGMKGARIVAAPYATKGIVPLFAVNVMPGQQRNADGLVEVVNAGTGFMLINRSVFETLEREGRAEEHMLGINDPDFSTHKTARAYFKSGVRKVRYPNGEEVKLWLTEDYMLCYEWQKCGGKVLMDYRHQLQHLGAATYPVDPREIVAAMRELRRINHPQLPPETI